MSRPMYRFLAACGVFAVLAGAVAGCGEDRPDRAVTVDPKGSASSGTDASGEEEAAVPQSSAGDQLTEAQIDAALLTVGDLPSGWTKSPEEADDDSEDTIEPARCQEVIDALDDSSSDAATEGEANFNRGGAFGTIMSETISSYADEVDADVVQHIADAFSDCPTFTSTDADGEVSKVTVSPMSFANLGDQTLAVAMSFESSMFTVQVNVAYVVIGHNVLALINGGVGGADGAELEKFAKLAVSKLEDTTA
ncbi:hypothetical protein [Nocardioides pyridinolyticus]